MVIMEAPDFRSFSIIELKDPYMINSSFFSRSWWFLFPGLFILVLFLGYSSTRQAAETESISGKVVDTQG